MQMNKHVLRNWTSLRKSEVAGNIQPTFIIFRFLEKESKLQGRRQPGESQQLAISSSDAVAEIFEIPETDTLLVKIMTVLQGSCFGVNIRKGLNREIIKPGVSGQSSEGFDVSAYCVDKLRFLSDGICKH